MLKPLKKLLISFVVFFSIFTTLSYADTVITKGEYISAKAHYGSGDYNTSYKLFEKLFQEHTDHVYVNYYLAMSAVKLKKYDEATAAFERVLIKKPDFYRARLEFAKVLYAIGFKEQSKKEFLTVLNSDVPQNVKDNIKRYLNSLDDKLFALEATFMIGWHYSDNVNHGLDNTEYNLPGLSNLRVSGDAPVSDNGDMEYIGLNFMNKLKDKPLIIQNKVFVYNKNLNDYDTGDLRFYSYLPTLIYSQANQKTQYSLGLGIDKIIPGKNKNDKFKTYSISPKYTTEIFKNTILSTYFKYQKIKYDEQNSKDRNYLKKEFAVNLYYKKLYGGMNLADDSKEQGNRTDIDKRIYSLNIGYTYDITNSFLLNLEYTYTRTKYKHEDIFFDSKRKDSHNELRISLAKLFNKNNIVNLSYTRNDNSSNQDAFKYDKDSTSISYIRKFQW